MPRKGELKRQQIVSTADGLFYQQGFHQTSLADIADACGIPKGNFYFHFKTKDDILDAVIDARAERLQARLTTWEKDYDDTLGRLLRMSQIVIRDWSDIVQFGCPVGTLALELSKQDDEPRAHALVPFDSLLEWMERQFTALAGPHNARKLARQMLVRMQGASVLANVFADEAWLFEEQQNIAEWLKAQVAARPSGKKGTSRASG